MLPSSSFTSKETVCLPATRLASSLEESVLPTTSDSSLTPSTEILPEVRSIAELSETVAEKAILLPLIVAPLSSVIAVSDIEYVGDVIVGRTLSSTAEL